MPSTLTPDAAYAFAKSMVKHANLADVKIRMLDDVSKMMWMAAPWRWTVGSMPLITLAAATQDYVVALPADYLYLLKAYSTDGSTTRPLDIEPALPTTGTKVGMESLVSVTGTPGQNGTLRVAPTPGGWKAGSTNKIIALYKKASPAITIATTSTAVLVFDDEWFWVYQEGVLWRAYQFADDARAPKQREAFEAALEMMKAGEPLLQLNERPGDQQEHTRG